MSQLLALEQAAFAAWPASEVEHYAGWRLQAAGGYTKRANSANAHSCDDTCIAADIAYCEAWLRERGITPTFRLPSFCSSAALDNALAARGYRYLEPSLVMTAALSPALPTQSAGSSTLLDSAAAWLNSYGEVRQAAPQSQALHLNILQAIPSPTAFALQAVDGQAQACGLAVVQADYLGIFDVGTRAEQRGQGLALCADLMRWGTAQGAHQAYVQVLAANVAAVRLYEKLGFRRAYQYWYRVAPAL